MTAASFRYHKLGYVALNVTDVSRSTRYYHDIVGLDVAETDGENAAFLRCGRDHHNVVLYRAATPGLKRVAFELESAEEMEKAYAHVSRLGLAPRAVDVAERAALKQGESFRFEEPNSGLTLEFYNKMMQMALPFSMRLTRIVRLGHVVLTVTEFDRTTEFLVKNLNFKVSDFVDGRFAFLRCHPNPLHHSFALGKGDENRLNHINFMVSDIDDIGIALNRLKKNNVEVVFGPGRHQPSGSIFLYFLDPDRMTVEYSFGMEEFPEDLPREPRMIEPRPEALDMWGGVPTPAFARVGSIERAARAKQGA